MTGKHARRAGRLALAVLGALWCQACVSVAAHVSQELLPDAKPLTLSDTAPVARIRLSAELRPAEGGAIQMTIGRIDNPRGQGVMVCALLVREPASAALDLGCISVFPTTAGGRYLFMLRGLENHFDSKLAQSSGGLSLSLQLWPVDERAVLAPLQVHIDSLRWKRDN